MEVGYNDGSDTTDGIFNGHDEIACSSFLKLVPTFARTTLNANDRSDKAQDMELLQHAIYAGLTDRVTVCQMRFLCLEIQGVGCAVGVKTRL